MSFIIWSIFKTYQNMIESRKLKLEPNKKSTILSYTIKLFFYDIMELKIRVMLTIELKTSTF